MITKTKQNIYFNLSTKSRLLTILFLYAISLSLCTQAQPNWLYKLPKPGNKTYLYVVESASGRTELEARNQAIIRVFQSNIMRLGYRISSSEITEAVQKGKTFEDIAILHRIPVNKVCEYTEHVKQGYRCYVLCQVTRDANIRPIWNDFTKCLTTKNNTKKRKKSNINDTKHAYIVIPSLGIMVQKEDLGIGSSFVGGKMCSSSQLGGYTNWRLPTVQELMFCYLNADLIGGFRTLQNQESKGTFYWTKGNDAIDFRNGKISYEASRDQHNVRAVRTMTDKEIKHFSRKKNRIVEFR